MKYKIFMFIAMLLMTINLQSDSCNVSLINYGDREDTFNYEVNGKKITVVFEKGLMFRLYGYVNGYKKETFKESFISSNMICFDSSMQNCKVLSSIENEIIINSFLKNSFCKE